MPPAELDLVFRAEWPRMMATLVRYTGSIELAEDSLQLAFERALASPDRGLLLNPGAWLITVAKHIAIDSVRRDANLRKKLPLLALDESVATPATPAGGGIGDVAGDDRLGMLFVACTPSISAESRLALALRFVGGLPTAEVAAVMLVGDSAMSARLTRAKRLIQTDGIRFEPEGESSIDERLPDVLSTIYAMYTVGHTSAAERPARGANALGSLPLRATAIELARALRRAAPTTSEVAGLLALLLLTQARDAGRLDESGRVITLEHADRRLWDGDLISEGLDLAAGALSGRGPLALQAGIAGLHCQAPDWAATDWTSIGLLYDRLVERWPSPSARIARIVARSYLGSHTDAPDAGSDGQSAQRRALADLDDLELPQAIERQRVAARADILRRLGRNHEARAAYGLARSMERNPSVADYYLRRMVELGD